jgi:hypothetical protein
MDILIQNWFRKVDIFPEVVNEMGDMAKTAWKVTYRDARLRAHLFCHSMDEMIKFRGFGVLKKIWNKKSGNCIGRIRTNDLKTFDNDIIAGRSGLTDYAPNRIL